jgi:hypothetical protein
MYKLSPTPTLRLLVLPPDSRTLADFEAAHLADLRRLHDEGERAGLSCPACRFGEYAGRLTSDVDMEAKP